MPQLNFTFDTGQVPLSKIIDAFASAYNYKDMIQTSPDDPTLIPNPETKQQFARRMVKNYIIDMVRAEDIKTAQMTINILPINLT